MFGVSNLPSDSDHVGLCFRQFRSGADATVRAPVSLFLTTPTCSLRDRPLTLVHRSRGRAKRGVIRSQSPGRGLNRYHYMDVDPQARQPWTGGGRGWGALSRRDTHRIIVSHLVNLRSGVAMPPTPPALLAAACAGVQAYEQISGGQPTQRDNGNQVLLWLC